MRYYLDNVHSQWWQVLHPVMMTVMLCNDRNVNDNSHDEKGLN